MAITNYNHAVETTHAVIWLALLLIAIGGFALVAAASMDNAYSDRSVWSGRTELAIGIFGVLAICCGLILLIDAILTI